MAEINKLKMNVPMKPLQSHSIASRCRCGQCGGTPNLRVSGSDPLTIAAECCGMTETRTVAKSELFFTQVFFETEEEDGAED